MSETRTDVALRYLRSRSAWWWVGVAVVALFAIGLLNGKDRDEPTADMAVVMCEDFVEDRLKSPASADFQRASATSAGVNKWRVSGSVDSQNSFGATMRVDYMCTVKADSTGGWKLVDLQHSQR